MDASTIILGFTGSIGSGSSYISSFIPEVADIRYKYLKLSDIIRNVLRKDGIEDPTTTQMQDKGDQLRRENGTGFLIGELISQIENDPNLNEYPAIIIDGIKNIGEVKTLRQFPFFFLLSVHSSFDVRRERVLDPEDNRFESIDDFKTADDRDRLEKDDETGQQVKKCNYLSDIIILNELKIPRVDKERKKKFIWSIYHNYCKLVENLKNESPSPATSPSIDELCMTIAYSQSKMSSCLKRKVGAAVVDQVGSIENLKNQIGKIISLPVIVSSGFNEVPVGSYKCVFHPKFEKCYRDHLQEEHAKKIIYCPNCSEKLKVETVCSYCNEKIGGFSKYCIKCQKEIEDSFKCDKCGSRVFEEFLPGGKETPGKLLDMCRALHAEENALLNLTRSNRASNGNLVLYVTSQPCNLCANKIVSAGIKHVVYDEPYPMVEALEILKAGGVSSKRFEGIKSTAYFRLY